MPYFFPTSLDKSVLSIAIIYGLTIPSAVTNNRYPIVVIFSFISTEMVFSLLSKVRLHGSSDNIDIYMPSLPFCCMGQVNDGEIVMQRSV